MTELSTECVSGLGEERAVETGERDQTLELVSSRKDEYNACGDGAINVTLLGRYTNHQKVS